MSRTKIIAGNWKMNTSLADAHVLATGIKNGVEHTERIVTVLCPPTIWLTTLAHDHIRQGTLPHLKLGAQNMYFEESGAYTGETSPAMVKEVADFVILGHSERMHVFRESLELVGHKVEAALAQGLTPIVCVGEDEKSSTSKDIVLRHLQKILADISKADLHKIVVAYEPVWAIGTGNSATPEYAQTVLSHLRTFLPHTSLLYGGSVNEENAKGYLELPDCDGLLIGGTSLKLKPFLTICQYADDVAQRQNHPSLHS